MICYTDNCFCSILSSGRERLQYFTRCHAAYLYSKKIAGFNISTVNLVRIVKEYTLLLKLIFQFSISYTFRTFLLT